MYWGRRKFCYSELYLKVLINNWSWIPSFQGTSSIAHTHTMHTYTYTIHEYTHYIHTHIHTCMYPTPFHGYMQYVLLTYVTVCVTRLFVHEAIISYNICSKQRTLLWLAMEDVTNDYCVERVSILARKLVSYVVFSGEQLMNANPWAQSMCLPLTAHHIWKWPAQWST